MVQALSVNTRVPTPLGETFAADQFLTSGLKSAVFDIAFLAPTLTSEGSADEVETVTVNTADSTQSAEGISGEASVEMSTGNDAAPVVSVLPTSHVSAQAVADHDIALVLSALAALEQTSRSPLIAQEARADLLPPSLKTRISNELAAPNSEKSVEMLSDTGLLSQAINLASFASIKRDEAHIDIARQQNDHRGEDSNLRVTIFPEEGANQAPIAALNDMTATPILGTSDQDIIILDVTEPKSEIVDDLAPSIFVEHHAHWPEAIEISSSPDKKSQPVISDISMASAFIAQSDLAMQDHISVSRNDIVVPAIIPAPYEDRPSFIGELIETPKPMILPNEPVPNAPRLPLADPSSHLDKPVSVFTKEALPPMHVHDEAFQGINQNLISNPELLISPVLEIIALEKSEKIDKTLKNTNVLTGLSTNFTDPFDHKYKENLSLTKNVNVTFMNNLDMMVVHDIFRHEISSSEQLIAPESNVTPDIITDDLTSRNKINPETFQKSLNSAIARNNDNALFAPMVEVDPINDQVQPALIDNAIIRSNLLAQKIEIATGQQTVSSIQNDDADFDLAEKICNPAVLMRDNGWAKDQTGSQSEPHEPLQRHTTFAMLRSNLNMDQNDDQKNVPFNTLMDKKSTLENFNRNPIIRLVADEQNAPNVIKNKIVLPEQYINQKPDSAKIREVTLVIRSVDQSETGLVHRTGFSAPTLTPETFTGSAATPFTSTREASTATVYASSDNPLFQFQRDRALEAQIIAALKSGQDKVRLSLYPPQLGQVTINLALDGHKVKVGLKTANREATNLLTTEQLSLSHALQQEGFTLEGFDVTEDDTHKHRANGDDQTKASLVPAVSGSSEFSIDITI